MIRGDRDRRRPWSLLPAIHQREPASGAVLDGEAMIVPQPVPEEVANGPWRACRMRRLMPTAAGLFQTMVAMDDLADAALDLALRRDHPAHESICVALAMRETIPVATDDRRLAERFAGDAGIDLIAQLSSVR